MAYIFLTTTEKYSEINMTLSLKIKSKFEKYSGKKKKLKNVPKLSLLINYLDNFIENSKVMLNMQTKRGKRKNKQTKKKYICQQLLLSTAWEETKHFL